MCRTSKNWSWLWRHCRRRAIYWLLWSPSQTCHAKPKTQINRRRTLPASFPLVGCLPLATAWKTSLERVRTLWHCSRLRSVALYLWLIDVGIVRQSTVAAISGLLPGAGYGQFEHELTAWLQIQRSGRNGQKTDVWAESPRLSPLWLSSSSACHGLFIGYRDNAITYKQRDKNARELKLANAAITDMQMRQRDISALDAKYTKELADAKAEMMLCVMMLH